MHKTKLTISAILCVMMLTANAQQNPYFSNFMYVQQAYNPATVGETENQINVRGLYHHQWAGMTTSSGREIANPRTGFLNVSFAPRKDSVTSSKYAFGISAIADRLGYMNTNSIKGQASYSFYLGKSHDKLLIGLEGGIMQFGFVDITRRLNNPTRDTTYSTADNENILGVGLLYKKEKIGKSMRNFYTGFSVSQVNDLEFQIIFIHNHNYFFYKLNRLWNFNLGTDINTANANMVISPSLLLNYSEKLKINANVMLKYREAYRAGVGYRQFGTSDAYSLVMGYQIKGFQLGYSYDLYFSKYRSISGGTHEVFTSYAIGL